jgi:hypothetical protein
MKEVTNVEYLDSSMGDSAGTDVGLGRCLIFVFASENYSVTYYIHQFEVSSLNG